MVTVGFWRSVDLDLTALLAHTALDIAGLLACDKRSYLHCR